MTLYPNNNGFDILRLEKTNSTSSCLRELCGKETVGDFTTIVAEHQTAGRGQRGNSWEAEAGKNLLFSFVLHPQFLQARRQFLLSQIVSLAIKEELDIYAGDISIKWPNDIYWKDKKISGILIEHDLDGNYISQSIAGIGINLNQKIFLSNAPNPISLAQITGKEYEIFHILNDILRRTQEYYEQLKEDNTDMIVTRYKDSLYRKDGFHPYRDANGEFRAEIFDVDCGGTLILRDDNDNLRKYAFKEVEFRL